MSTFRIWLVSGMSETVWIVVFSDVILIFVDVLLAVENEMRTCVSESGVMSGVLVSSEAFILVSLEVFISFIRLGNTVTDVKSINRGIITAKAVFRGIPQSL